MQLSKVLLGSTALLGVGAIAATDVFAAAHSSVNVEGFVRFEVNGGDTDEKFGDDTENFDFQTDSEVHVNYRTTDEESGIRYGATVEFETDTNQTINTDEVWMFFSGGFGEVRLGDEDGATDNSKVGGFTVAAGTGGIDGEGNVGSSAIAIANSGDNTKVRYYTPTIAGFSAGVSYTPNDGSGGSDRAADIDRQDFVEGALVYTGSFGGLDIKGSLIGGFASGENGNDDFQGYGGGLQVGLFGFDVAGGIFYDEGVDGNDDDERTIANAGVAAELGPATVSLTYGYVDDDRFDDEESNIVLSASLGLLPGVSLDGDVSFFEDFQGGDAGNDGVTATGRLGVSF